MGAAASITSPTPMKKLSEKEKKESPISFRWPINSLILSRRKKRSAKARVDPSITDVPTYDKINPYDSGYQIHSKLGRFVSYSCGLNF